MMKFAKGVVLAAVLATSTTPALAAGPSDKEVYSAFLDYVKAQFSFEGDLYNVLSPSQQAALAKSFASLNTAYAKLIDVLQSKVSAS